VLEARAVLAGSGQGDRAGVVPFFFQPPFFWLGKRAKERGGDERVHRLLACLRHGSRRLIRDNLTGCAQKRHGVLTFVALAPAICKRFRIHKEICRPFVRSARNAHVGAERDAQTRNAHVGATNVGVLLLMFYR
jgi:hypothetical protein